ncbi:MAG: MGMT family protein [Leptospirales bacterium]|nr:MGMT family protein [Leptospirales bacterium]
MERKAESKLAAFTERVCRIAAAIPAGRLMSYGMLAACAGNPRGARQVARILHSLSRKRRLPWHRIVNRQGRISLPLDSGGRRQQQLLAREGLLPNASGVFDLQARQWQPDGVPEAAGH